MPDCRCDPTTASTHIRAVIDALKTDDVDQTRREMLEHLDKLRKGDRGDNLPKLVNAISRRLFDGALQNVECAWDENMTLNGEKVFGTTTQTDEGAFKITIDKDPTLSPNEVLGTIIHECVHAYFCVTCCFGRCKTASCEETKSEQLGMGFHGPAWEALARKMEKAFKEFFAIEIVVNIDYSVDNH